MSSVTTQAKGANSSMIALIVGIVGLVVAGFGFVQGFQQGEPRHLMSWLIGVSFWLMIAVGMVFLIQIWYVFHARWAVVVRRQCEHFISVFPVLFVLFIPLLAVPFLHENPGLLWKWLNPVNPLPGHGIVGEDPLYQWKSAYLNTGFFVVRAVIVFASFSIIAMLLRKWSFDTDKTGDINNTHNSRRFASVGLFISAVAATVGAIDWMKSLEYHWFSTMYGVWFFAASMRAALAFLIIFCTWQASKGYLKGIFNQAHRYDICCMMLTFTIFWAYISFSQYFIIYNANIPEEVFWYSIRETNFDGSLNTWWSVSMCLVFAHFLTPFLCLLWYKTKVVVWRSVAISCWILTFSILDLYWNIIPGKIPEPGHDESYLIRQFSISVYDIAALIGVGGICLFFMFRSMKKVEPIPVRDPNILKSINHAE